MLRKGRVGLKKIYHHLSNICIDTHIIYILRVKVNLYEA